MRVKRGFIKMLLKHICNTNTNGNCCQGCILKEYCLDEDDWPTGINRILDNIREPKDEAFVKVDHQRLVESLGFFAREYCGQQFFSTCSDCPKSGTCKRPWKGYSSPNSYVMGIKKP